MNRFDGTRASTGAVLTPVGARVVAILSRSRWIVAQAAAGNTQAPTRGRRWADLLSLFENQKRVKRANSEKTEIFGDFRLSDLSMIARSDLLTRNKTNILEFFHNENKVTGP